VAWETSDRRSRLPANWQELVAKVKDRDQRRCTWRLPSGKRCPRAGTDVDHRKPGDDHALSNLQLLCRHHHDKKTQREAWAGKGKRRVPKRPEERHPGAQ
jgi:hypothetical protein